MPFQLEQPTQVRVTNVNVRRELHGEEHVRAVDIAMTLEGENTLLDLIESGLREHEYCNRAAEAAQEPLPDVIIPLPNVRFPKLPERQQYGSKRDRARGYRFILDFGLGGDSNLDFTDCVLASLWYERKEGGTVKIGWTIQYNGDELDDNEVYGRLAGLATEGEGHVQIIAPPMLQLVKKGWRSGKPDVPATDGGAPLFDNEEDPDEYLDPDSPEGHLAATAGGA
jgi:hypothetical protein